MLRLLYLPVYLLLEMAISPSNSDFLSSVDDRKTEFSNKSFYVFDGEHLSTASPPKTQVYNEVPLKMKPARLSLLPDSPTAFDCFSDNTVLIVLNFCSDTNYTKAEWKWKDGSIDLSPPIKSFNQRLVAHIAPLSGEKSYCYRAELVILLAEKADEGTYTLVVATKNEEKKFNAKLAVDSKQILVPTEEEAQSGSAGAVGLAIGFLGLILAIVLLYALVQRKWVFKGSDDVSSEDSGSDIRRVDSEGSSVPSSVSFASLRETESQLGQKEVYSPLRRTGSEISAGSAGSAADETQLEEEPGERRQTLDSEVSESY